MKHKFILFLCAIALTVSCTQNSAPNSRAQRTKNWFQPNGKIKVLSTTAMIGQLVQQIGGNEVDNLTLITGELDPHSYQLVKGDDEKFKNADIVFANGLGLEHGPSLHTALKNSKNAVAIGDEVRKKSPSLILLYNGVPDPHIWMDVSLWSKTIPSIVKALSQERPNSEELFKKNAAALQEELTHLHTHVEKIIRTIPEERRYLVTSHDAFNYFARAYLATEEEKKSGNWKERFQAPEGLAPDSQLSSADIQHIVNFVRKHNIPALFPESNLSQESIQKIMETGKSKGLFVKIVNPTLYGDAMGPPGSSGDTYQKMLLHNASTIQKALSDE